MESVSQSVSQSVSPSVQHGTQLCANKFTNKTACGAYSEVPIDAFVNRFIFACIFVQRAL
jgi:hypothetical protein